MGSLSSECLEQTFAAVERAAVAGERCPTNALKGQTNGVTHDAIPSLARQGRVRIEVYPHNWRVVEITKGPNTGKRTAEPPNKHWRPWRIIDQNGERRRYNGI